MPRPAGRPTRRGESTAAGATSARIWFATAAPSSSRAVKLPTQSASCTQSAICNQSAICTLQSAISFHRLGLELFQRLRVAEDDELVARENRGVGLGVELHPLIS